MSKDYSAHKFFGVLFGFPIILLLYGFYLEVQQNSAYEQMMKELGDHYYKLVCVSGYDYYVGYTYSDTMYILPENFLGWNDNGTVTVKRDNATITLSNCNVIEYGQEDRS